MILWRTIMTETTNKKRTDEKEEVGFFGNLYNKAKAKIKEEVQQFNDMGGWRNVGKYVTENATTLGVKAAKAVKADELAEKIENKRETIVQVGKDFDDKVAEEIQQFNDMGGLKGVGKYVAKNATTLGVKAAKAVKADELAEKIESKRETIEQVGKDFDDKVAEEIQQFNDIGGIKHVGEYVAQNVASLGVKTAEALGLDNFADKIENNREAIVGAGKGFDNKIAEEVQQFNDMGGIEHVGEYVAQNTASLGVKTAEALGLDNFADKIENNREAIVGTGKDFDARIAEEVQQFNDMGGASHAGEYVGKNLGSLGVTVATELGLDGIAQNMEDSREALINEGKLFDKNTKENGIVDAVLTTGDRFAQNLLSDLDNDIENLKQDLSNAKGELTSSPIATSRALRIDAKLASHDAEKAQKEEVPQQKVETKVAQASVPLVSNKNQGNGM